MKKITIALLLCTVTLLARFSAMPTQQCEAFNNMKHSKNSHHVVLEKGKNYTIIKKHKGQYLTLIKGESPAQRWVDASCFNPEQQTKKVVATQKYKKKESSNSHREDQSILVLSWHNAFCETHRNKKECRISAAKGKSHLVLHGLWPQPRNNIYCNVSSAAVSKDKYHQWRALPNLDLAPSTIGLLQSYMPGHLSALHKHEWIKHGTCYTDDADAYYHDALNLTQEVDTSPVGDLFRKNIGKSVTLRQVRQAFDRSFGKGTGRRVEMKCKQGLVTELWIHIGGHGDELSGLITKGKTARSRCNKARVDAR